jgi:hypothetical protein
LTINPTACPVKLSSSVLVRSLLKATQEHIFPREKVEGVNHILVVGELFAVGVLRYKIAECG